MEFFFPEFDAEEFYLKVILLPGLIVMSGPVLVCSLVMKLYFFAWGWNWHQIEAGGKMQIMGGGIIKG